MLQILSKATIVVGLCLSSLHSYAAVQTLASDPATDPKFLVLPDGRDLKTVKVKGAGLTLSRGIGSAFGSSAQASYQKLKTDSQALVNHSVQWVLMNLDTGEIFARSRSTSLKMFGASVSKIYVAGAFVDKQKGQVSNSQLQTMADMLVVSSNTAWLNLQSQIGGGDADKGRAGIHDFTQRMGYLRTRGFQGYLGTMHGNELTADEIARFLYDTYHAKYVGSEIVWKLMHTVRTGASRARKYLPTSLVVGGKTGTYDGPTVDPETGSTKNPDGSSYNVKVRHHAVVMKIGGQQFGLAILANTGSDESSAVLAGGLYREYLAPLVEQQTCQE